MVMKVFRRIEKTYGNSSFYTVRNANGSLPGNPAMKQGKARCYRQIAKNDPGQNRRANNPMGNIKYGIRVPKKFKEALELDKVNGNHLWCDSIIKEIEALMGHITFAFLNENAKSLKKKEFKFAPLCMVFDMKQDSRRKAQLVIGGHVLDSSNMDTYALVMEAISQRLLLVIALANNYELLVGDIKNAYLYANCDIDVYTRVGPEFTLAGYDELPEGSLAKI